MNHSLDFLVMTKNESHWHNFELFSHFNNFIQ